MSWPVDFGGDEPAVVQTKLRLTRGVVRLSKGTERLIAIVVLVMLGLSSTLAVAEAP